MIDKALEQLYVSRKELVSKIANLNWDFRHREEFVKEVQKQIDDIDEQVQNLLDFESR